jgi:hypothetical protein
MATLHIDLGRHPVKIEERRRDDTGAVSGRTREHKDGHVDVKVLVPACVHRAYDYAPEQNAAMALRFPQLVDVRRLPFSREVLAIVEDVTGRRYQPWGSQGAHRAEE